MICTEIYNGQDLGNQLWYYVVTTSVSLVVKKNIDKYKIFIKK